MAVAGAQFGCGERDRCPCGGHRDRVGWVARRGAPGAGRARNAARSRSAIWLTRSTPMRASTGRARSRSAWVRAARPRRISSRSPPRWLRRTRPPRSRCGTSTRTAGQRRTRVRACCGAACWALGARRACSTWAAGPSCSPAPPAGGRQARLRRGSRVSAWPVSHGHRDKPTRWSPSNVHWLGNGVSGDVSPTSQT